MPNLTTQTAKINCVLSLNDSAYEKVNDIMQHLAEWCETNCKMYAFILHDKDTLDDGTLKTPHLHLVALLNSNRWRLSTTLNNISAATGLNELAISIDKTSDFNGSIQYLIHRNNKDKYQYNVIDIQTNLPSGELDVYLTSETGGVSIELLVSIVKKHRSIIDIIREIGLQNYRLYRNVIWDVYAEIHQKYL